ncbi:DUF6404 family protein [Streptomyces sp. NPDC052051]|uniref:DUF6404 family protein n=1 Tax=Streptomyces sp. NPDC052051 TaxID=3154649 RepID=UPI0034355D23
MANWRRSLAGAFWALDRALGGQRRPTRFQTWVARRPVTGGLCVAVPVTLFFAIFFGLSPDDEVLENLLFAALFGAFLGLVFGLTAASERLRQRRLKRLRIWDGS